MNTFFAGESVTLQIPLMFRGEYVICDEDSLTWTLRGHDGTLLDSGDKEGKFTSAILTFDSVHQTITREIENRFVQLNFTSDGNPRSLYTSYRLINFVPMTVQVEDVRSYLGLTEEELEDHEVDLPGAYLSVKTKVTDIDQRLLEDPLQANELIKFWAIRRLLPTLELRAHQRRETDSNSAQRFPVDFDKLRARIEDELEALIPMDGTEEPLLISTFSTQPDPFTGE